MRIAYACYRNAFRLDGVVRKIGTQTTRWRAAGHDVEVFALTPPPRNGAAPALDAELFTFASLRERVAATRALTRAVARFAPDLLYLRYDFFVPPPRALMRRVPTVVEINTDERGEVALRTRQARLIWRPNRRVLLAEAAGFVCVTHELAAATDVGARRRPIAVIANGIDPAAAQTLPAPANARPRAAFLGLPDMAWHGLDKIVELARARPELDIELIGPRADQLGGGLPSNVTAHGFLARDDYEPVLAACDIALGTLALHRKAMDEASPLKTREYLLSGLPTVIGYRDTDFLDERPWYLLEIANREANVRERGADIAAYAARMRGRRVPRADVLPRVSADVKEAERLAFFDRVRHAGAPAAARTRRRASTSS